MIPKDQNPVSVKALNVSYDKKRVLSSVYLNLEFGNVYGLLGPNGAGKSTLFKAVLDLIDYDTGDIKIGKKSIEEYRKEVVYVPQRDDIDMTFPATVYDIVKMGRYPHLGLFQKLTKHDKKEIEDALKEMGVTHLRDRQIGQLSGGQQQRVFLARAKAQEAQIWLLDEPFVGIDATTEAKIMELLHKEAEEGKCVVVIHHDLSTVKSYFDKVILLNRRIVAYGNTDEVFTDRLVAETYGSQMAIQHKTDMLSSDHK